MASIEDVAVKIRNYKCFGAEFYGYEKILPLNLIIGRNNTGKSTLIDLIAFLTNPIDLSALGHRGQHPEITLSGILGEGELRRVFSNNISGGHIPGNHWNYGSRWIGHPVTWGISHNGLHLIAVEPKFDPVVYSNYGSELARLLGNPFAGLPFRRLLADRDIISEDESSTLMVGANGAGLTNAIRAYLLDSSLPSALIEVTLLRELNSIFEPDGTITRLLVQRHGNNGTWELYLEEAEKGRVPLSHTGSGLKTIVLVLAFIHLIPHIEGKSLSEYLFGFEELENNLHPALQRRLLLYLRQIALKEGCRFFLTTHSNVAIDLFASDDKAQIIHVTHDRTCAAARRVTTYIENKGILDDLDIRASDLLQSNGIIWLEGPSDRLYFNRWVELWTNGEFREGAHYQCVFYGGRLLAHLSANDPDVDTAEAVKILRVNRNAIVLIDSDKRRANEPINPTKKRITAEVAGFNGMAWVTSGREVENYIPLSTIEELYGQTGLTPLDRYGDFAEYLDSFRAGEGKRFLRNKVMFAEQVCPHLTRERLLDVLDWKGQIEVVCNRIRTWNGLPPH